MKNNNFFIIKIFKIEFQMSQMSNMDSQLSDIIEVNESSLSQDNNLSTSWGHKLRRYAVQFSIEADISVFLKYIFLGLFPH
jgi:hypothetical protein